MSHASLPHLPSELKIQIFGFLDNFSTVTALSCTSRTFHSIWKLNAKHICDAVLQRVIECPVEAKALIDAQQSTRQTKDYQSLNENQKDQNDYQQAVERVQQYLTNVDMASLNLKYFEDLFRQGPEIGRMLSSTERAHFMQAYYRARVLVLFSKDGIPTSLITPWNILDFKRVYEVLDYIFMYSSGATSRQIPALVSSEESETLLGRGIPACKIALHRMDLLEDDIFAVLPEADDSWPVRQPFFYFITYDPLVSITDKLRNVPLAEILPLVPDGTLYRDVDLDGVYK